MNKAQKNDNWAIKSKKVGQENKQNSHSLGKTFSLDVKKLQKD